MWGLIGLLFLVLGVLLVVFSFGMRYRSTHRVSRTQEILVVAVLFISTAWVFYAIVFDKERITALAHYETLLPDVANFLETGEASEGIRAMNAASLISLLGYYARAYPRDERVWEKLAIIMMNLEQPDQALKAIRRYLTLEPAHLKGREIEIQLLITLVRENNSISPRQLEFALKNMLARDDIATEQRIFLGGIAEEFGFLSLAISVWTDILALDNRADQALSLQAREGRQLVRNLLARAKAAYEKSQLSSAIPIDSSTTDAETENSDALKVGIDAAILKQTIQVQFSDSVQAELRTYLSANEAKWFHLWVSLKAGGPPLAAKLIWGNQSLLTETGLEFQFTKTDLVMVPNQLQGPVVLSGLLVLSDEQSDPMVAQGSPWQGQLSVDLNETVEEGILPPRILVIESVNP